MLPLSHQSYHSTLKANAKKLKISIIFFLQWRLCLYLYSCRSALPRKNQCLLSPDKVLAICHPPKPLQGATLCFSRGHTGCWYRGQDPGQVWLHKALQSQSSPENTLIQGQAAGSFLHPLQALKAVPSRENSGEGSAVPRAEKGAQLAQLVPSPCPQTAWFMDVSGNCDFTQATMTFHKECALLLSEKYKIFRVKQSCQLSLPTWLSNPLFMPHWGFPTAHACISGSCRWLLQIQTYTCFLHLDGTSSSANNTTPPWSLSADDFQDPCLHPHPFKHHNLLKLSFSSAL